METELLNSLCIELAVALIYQAWKSVGLDPGFGIISSFRKFSKSGFNHLSVQLLRIPLPSNQGHLADLGLSLVFLFLSACWQQQHR